MIMTADGCHSILVVEDSLDIAFGLRDFLEHDGYQATVVGTLQAARAAIRERRFNAILLDLGLPDGDGSDILKEMQQLDATVPIVILTAHVSRDHTVGSLIKGAYAYLTKPYNSEELRHLLRRAIGVKELALKVERTTHLLSESEDRFRSLVESASDAIVVGDGRGTIVSWNRAASILFGYSEEEVLGRPLTILMPSRYHQAHRAGLARMEATGQGRVLGTVLQLDGRRKDGTEFPIELSLATWKTGQGHFYSGIIRDTSERIRAEQAVQQLRHQRDLILTQAGDGIFGLDREGHTTFVNPSAAGMLGYRPEDLFGVDMHEVLHHSRADGTPYPVKACPIHAAIKDGTIHRVSDEVFWRQNGTHFPVEYTATPIREGADVIGAVIVFRDMTDRKAAERAVEESQKRFRQLAEHIREVFWITDPAKHQMIYISPTYEDIWMRSCESLYASPRSWIEAIHPQDRDRIEQAAANQGSGRYEEQYRIVRPDGSLRWIWDRAFPIVDETGTVSRIVGIAEDITDRKAIEEALVESERKYRALFDENPSMYFMVDAEGLVLSVNRAGADRLGYRPDDLLGQSILNVFYEPDRETVRHNLELCLAHQGRPMKWEVRKVRKEGSVIWVRETAQGIRNEHQIPVVLIVCEDITAVKEGEQALRDSEEFKNHILRSTTDSIKVLDLDGRIQFVNEAGRDLLQIGPVTSLINTSWADLWQGEDRAAALRTLAAAKAGEIGGFIGSRSTAAGQSTWWDVRITPMVDARHLPIRLLVISRDITEYRRAQDALRAGEERLELVIQGSRDGFWDGRVLPDEPWTSPRTPVWYSPRFRELLEYGHKEFPEVLESWASCLHPQDRDRVFAALKAHLERQVPYDVEYRLRTKRGAYRWFRARGQALWDADGRPTRMAGSLQWLHDRPDIDGSASGPLTSIGAWSWDLQTGRLVWSPQAERLLGVMETRALTIEDWLARVHPDDRTRIAATLLHIPEQPGEAISVEHRVRPQNGELRWVRWQGHVIRNQERKPIHVLGTFSPMGWKDEEGSHSLPGSSTP